MILTSLGLDPKQPTSGAHYTLERVCPGAGVLPPAPCSSTELTPWTSGDVEESGPFALPPFNYEYPVKLTVVDTGYIAERYKVLIDGIETALTSDYTPSPSVYCGETAAKVGNCLGMGASQGSFIVPSGSHSVSIGTFKSSRSECHVFIFSDDRSTQRLSL